MFLKRMKGNSKNLKGRTINILIISMQIISPIVVNIVNWVTLSQESTFAGMINGYVALGFILTIDDLFQDIFPQVLKDNVDNLNESGLLVMSEDNNTAQKLIRRLCRKKNRCRLDVYF